MDVVVTGIRVVAHSPGPIVPSGILSQNHWSIYLLVEHGGSVRVNMALRYREDQNGSLTLSLHDYTHVHSEVKAFEVPVSPDVTIGKLLHAIWRKKRFRYKMTESGAGCRYWMWVVSPRFPDGVLFSC